MTKWFSSNATIIVGFIGSIIINAAILGAFLGSMKADINHDASDIASLKDQRSDETRMRVTALERRADAFDLMLAKISDKLDRTNDILSRVDQRTAILTKGD